MDPIYFQTKNNLVLHLKDDQERPFVLIAPGGGYAWTSPREADPIAKSFNQAGFHAGIIYYRETLLKYPEALDELASIVLYLKSNADKFHIENKKIILCGFSSGGHYMANFGVNHMNYGLDAKPFAQLLIYPVITGKMKYAHEDSILRLMGNKSNVSRSIFSLENKVTPQTPPTFLVSTMTDVTVPVENSLFFFEALKNNQVKVDLHLFHKGEHGLSLGTKEVAKDNYKGKEDLYEIENKHFQSWFSLAISFLKSL